MNRVQLTEQQIKSYLTCRDNDMPVISDNIKYLQQAQIFADLSAEELNSIAYRVSLREFRKGQVILYEEDTNEYMYSVLEGEVRVFYTTEEGKETIVAFHGAGESFGEVSLIDQLTTPATVAAMEKSLVLTVKRDVFFDIVQNHPKVMNRLLLLLTKRLRHSWSHARMLHFKDASYRIMASIKEMAAKRGEEVPEGVLLKLRLTHQNIADMTGLTRETVTRVIDKWKKSGLLTIDKNRHMLISHSCFDENFSL
ncbi:MAG: cyclic nucleotide-binding domain-containing protein [Desulfuromonadales bacterium]|nr:cyclic nucleotide-binding domain-containing protein [Desulfuromonadales bacterium]